MHYIRIYDFNENIDDQVIEILDNIKNLKLRFNHRSSYEWRW